MPLPDFGVRSTSRFAYGSSVGPSSVNSAIRSVALGSMSSSKYSQGRKASTTSQEKRRVVGQAVICAGSLRVRSCKLLWKPAALQLMVTTTTSLSEDESHFDDCDDDSGDSDDDDIDKLTTMTRPNTTHHYSLVFCHRSLMGHARRERIELDGTRDPIEFIWGEDGLLSTRFEFSIVYGGRRRTLTCRARDAKEYLQWTEALRMAMTRQGKRGIKMNRSTQASSKASSNFREPIGSYFDASVVEEQQQLLERQAARKVLAPTSPTAATAAQAIAPPEADIAEGSALKPVPADIAAAYGVGRRRQVSTVVRTTPRPVGTRLQRRKQSGPPVGAAKARGSIPKAAKPATLPPFGRPYNCTNGENAKPHHLEVTVFRPPPAGQRRRRTSSAARRTGLMPTTIRVRKISLSDGARQVKGAWTPDTNSSGSKRSRLRVSPTSKPEEKRPRVPSSPLALAPVLGALPMLQSPSSLTDSPLDIYDEHQSTANLRTTDYVNSLVNIAGVSSATQRQQLLQLQCKKARPVSKGYGLPLLPCKSDEDHEDPWLLSCRSSRLNLYMCDFEDINSSRSNRRRTHGAAWAAYLKAMECEL